MRARFWVTLVIVTITALLAACSARRSDIASNPAVVVPALEGPFGVHTPEQRAGVPEDGALEAADYFRSRRMPPGETEFPWDRYDLARTRIAAMRKYSVAQGRELSKDEAAKASSPRATPTGWQPLGPGNVGGRTRGLVVNPSNPLILYAGGATGGVWKTADGGQTWNNTSTGFTNIVIGALVMDPANPNTLYAGTGEFFSNYRGSGIYKTTDAGSTWTQLVATKNSNFYFVNKLAVSPNSSQRIYAATNTGIWASPDGGATWKQQVVVTSLFGCREMVIRPDQKTDYLFAVCGGATTTADNRIYRNTDAAGQGTWQSVFTAADMGHTSLAIAPSQPSTIYALAADGNYSTTYARGLLAFFRSTANGDPGSWITQTSNTSTNRINLALLSNPDAVFLDTCPSGSAAYGGQGDYDNVIAVDPTNPNTVFAGGIDVFRSDDGGLTWGDVMHWDAAKNTAHADNHAIVFHPGYDGKTNQTVFLGNDGGVWQSDNVLATPGTEQAGACAQSANSIVWKSLNNSYYTTQFYFGAVYPGGAAYLGGLQDNGTLRGIAGRGTNWDNLFTGDGGGVAIDPANLNTVFWALPTFFLNRSIDGGQTSSAALNGLTESQANFNFITQYILDPNNTQRLYVGGKTLWRSDDSASSWVAASAPFPYTVSRLAVAPGDSSHMLLGTDDGTLYANRDLLNSTGTTKWTGVRPRTGIPSAIAFDPSNPATAYVAYSSFNLATTDVHLYKTTDNGATWHSVDISGAAGSVDVPVNSVTIDPLNPQTVYLGTDLGVLVSTNGGQTWSVDANGFGEMVVSQLILDRGAGTTDLYAFTYGGGVWKVSLPNSGTPCNYSISPASIEVPAGGGVVPVSVNTNPGCMWSVLPNSGKNAGTWITPQAPSTGTGPGTANVIVAPNINTLQRQTSLYLQGQLVNVTQGGAVFLASDTMAGAGVVNSIPYAAVGNSGNLTSSATDPVHSCTGSADFKTAWWKFTPSSSGTVQITAIGEQNISGFLSNSGVVLTAYPANGTALGSELGCTTVPRDAGTTPVPLVPTSIQIQVSAGSVYYIEVSSLTGSGAPIYLMTVGPPVAPAPTLRMSPLGPGIGPGQSVQFTVKATGANGAVRWLLTPAVGNITSAGLYTAPAAVTASLQVTVTAQLLANPSVSASSTMTISPPGPISFTAASIGNVWSGRGGAVSPGEVVVIYGSGLGPQALATATLTSDSSHFTTSAGTTQVFFDGVAAPIIYSYSGAVALTVPYEVADKASTQVQILYNGQSSAVATVPVAAAAPGILTSGTTGAGQATLFNQDVTFNSASHPAPVGSIISMYVTGEGLTTPAEDGLINYTSFPALTLKVSATIGGVDAKVNYVSEAPGIISGVAFIQLIVPNIPASNSAPLVVTIGGIQAQAGVTMCVSSQ